MSDIEIPNDRYMRLYPILLFIALLQLFSNSSKGQTEPKDMEVADEVLGDYLGQYALAPNFILTFKYHPRPYEFTTKSELNQYFDSLTNAIEKPADEIQFRYYLMPAVAKVHCGHTSLSPSFQLQQYRSTLFQPFVMYYEGNRAFIRNSAYPS